MSRRFCKAISILITLVIVAGLFPGNLLYADSDEQPIESSSTSEESFPYAVFAESTEDDLSFYGWKCNITGDIYSGRDFVFQGSELNMNGFARTAGAVQPSERKENMTGAEEGIEPLLMPMWGDAIKANETRLPSILPEELSSQDSIEVNGYFYSENDITINGTSFSGDAIIVSKGNITYNVCSLNTEGKVILYSEEGDININGTQIGINGILYAPQGRVTINAYDVTVNGRIVADRFSYSGSILNIMADPSDLTFLQDITEPTPDITPTEEPTQAPTEEPTETPSPTEEPTVSPSVTTVPTEEPTVEPTEEPTVEPTDIPSDTPTPTEKPLDLETDTDGDLIPDDLEIELGTDPGDPDSDMDGLNDYIEILLGYDPMSDDSDGDGIKDGDEDYDRDGIDNFTEMKIGTELSSGDSDCDELSDKDEIDIYGTDPLSDDTDKDGIRDGDEIYLGKNPLDDSDKHIKIHQIKTINVYNADDPSLVSVEVSIDLSNRIDEVLDIKDVYGLDVYSSDISGRVGSPVSFECEEDFDTATVTFYYDENKLREGIDEEQLCILWFDEDNGLYEVQQQAENDVEDNRITLTVDHFSTYIMADGAHWDNEQYPLDTVYLLNGAEQRSVDIIFAINCGSTMTTARKEMAMQAIDNIVSQMDDGDRYSYVLFGSNGAAMSPRIYPVSAYPTVPSGMRNYIVTTNYGGQGNLYNAECAADNLYFQSNIEENGNQKVIVVISDENVIYSSGFGNYFLTYNFTWHTLCIPGTYASVLSEYAGKKGGLNFRDCTQSDIAQKILAKEGGKQVQFSWADEDKDDIPDVLEKNGMLGTNNKVYYSDPCTKHSDDDGIEDGVEMGAMYSVQRIDEETVRINRSDMLISAVEGSEYSFLKKYISDDTDEIRFVFKVVSDPMKEDTDGDYYRDDIDPHPLVSDVETIGLGGVHYNPYRPDEGYIHVIDSPTNDYLESLGYTNGAYGGNQSWFGNSAYDNENPFEGNKLFIEESGCGIIATNDVLQYLSCGDCSYTYPEYYDLIMDIFDDFFLIGFDQLYISYSLSTSSIIGAMDNHNIKANSIVITNDNQMNALEKISQSIANDKPVILFENDRFGGDGISMYMMNYNDVGEQTQVFIPSILGSSYKDHYHFTTITGIVIDHKDNRKWLRVQSWGKEYYIRWEDFVEYNDSSLREGIMIVVVSGEYLP